MVAACIATLVLGALANAVASIHGMVRAQRETIAANQLLVERLEQMRSEGWTEITSSSYLRDHVLAVASSHARFLARCHETITVSTYPPVTPAPTPVKVERRADGTVTTLSDAPGGFSLRQSLAVRIDLHVDWASGQGGRSRVRETSSVVALGGLLR
jgi:hypothetical protein